MDLKTELMFKAHEKMLLNFKKSKILVLTEKFNFTDFHSMFPNKFIGVSDIESNPVRQYQI